MRLDDPTAIFVGELTDCCQALNDAGESCMRHSVNSKNGRVLVVQDEKGKVLSQSWIWRNKNVLCFDNIEAIKKDSDNRKIVSHEILDVIKQAAKDFVQKDKEGLEQWKNDQHEILNHKKEQKEITQEDYDLEISKIDKIIKGQQLSRVTVGIGYTDVNLKGLKCDTENRYPEESVDYIRDSRTQLVLYEDKSVENEKTDLKTVAIYSDSDDVKKLINVDTSEVEQDEEYYDDDEEYYDEYYDDEEEEYYDDDEEEYYDEYYYDDYEEYYGEYEESYNADIIDEKESNSKIKFVKEVYDDYQYDEIVDEVDPEAEFDKINLEDIRKTINHVVGRSEAKKALQRIEKFLTNERNEK